MKTAIVYASVHHGNTKKIIDEIAKTNDVELIDATQTVEKDLSEYDLIGFASGVYGGKFHQSVLKFASVNLTDNKNVFLICTYGGRPVFKSIEKVIAYKHDTIVGRFSCKGFDTFGPFKLIGGVSKGHPDEKDIAAAVEFYNGLTEQPVFLKLICTPFTGHPVKGVFLCVTVTNSNERQSNYTGKGNGLNHQQTSQT